MSDVLTNHQLECRCISLNEDVKYIVAKSLFRQARREFTEMDDPRCEVITGLLSIVYLYNTYDIEMFGDFAEAYHVLDNVIRQYDHHQKNMRNGADYNEPALRDLLDRVMVAYANFAEVLGMDEEEEEDD